MAIEWLELDVIEALPLEVIEAINEANEEAGQ